MNIDKAQILELLRSQGSQDQQTKPTASCPTRSTPTAMRDSSRSSV